MSPAEEFASEYSRRREVAWRTLRARELGPHATTIRYASSPQALLAALDEAKGAAQAKGGEDMMMCLDVLGALWAVLS